MIGKGKMIRMCDCRQIGLQFNSRTMGNQQASETNLSLTSQEREDWVKVEDQGYCELWANRKTNRRFQAYPISDATARDNVQIEKYAFRKIHNAYLVSAEAVISQNQSFLCSEPVTSFVLIQNIVGRLRSYARALSFEEALYVLSSAATGYNTICSFFGPLEPNEDLVCFNDEGQVKVWLNENLSKNEASTNARSNEFEPANNEDYSLAKRRSRACVEKLLKIVEISSQQGYPRAFEEETRNLSTFFEISNFVDYFCEKSNIHMPDRIRLNRTIMNAPLQSTNVVNLPTRSLPLQSQSQLQSVSSLQRSRVNRVFQSNHQREGVIPLVSTPVIQFGSNLPFRYPVQQITQPAQATWVQNHSASYGYSPIIQRKPVIISVPPSQNVTASLPVKVQQLAQVTNITQEPEKVIIETQIQQQVHVNFKEVPQSQSNDHIEANQKDYNESSHLQQEQISLKIDYHSVQQPEQGENVEQQQEKVEEGIPYQNEEEWHEQEQHHGLHYNEAPTLQEHQQIYEQSHNEKQEPKERIASSVYSNIEQYAAPLQQPQQVIEQKKEQYIVSPKNKSLQIEDWEQRLTQFTQSNQKNQNNIVVVPVQNKQPESFKNLVVSEQKEEYVNQLADLQTDDIEKYIRMKYQSYLNEKPQSQAQSYNAEPAQNYLAKVEQYKPASYLYSDDNTYTSAYVSNAYRTSNPYNEDDRAQQIVQKTYYRPFQYKSQEKWQIEAKQKENLPASYRYDLPSDNRASIDKELQYNSSRRSEPSNFGAKYESQLDQINMEQYYPSNVSKRTSERSKGNRNSNLIDEKYSKYVLNSQKPKRPNLNMNSEDVSLILPVDESHLTKYSARPILEKSFEHESFSYNKPAEKKGITYEKLRNLLWEQ